MALSKAIQKHLCKYIFRKGENILKEIITKKELIMVGFSEYTSEKLIKQSKQIMVKNGYPFYNNKRIGYVPKKVVESILGCKLELEETTYGKN
ncbi:DUF3173 family protein [Enterococcus faecalis]|uniref:DUF3173 family protein n=1 Tax=Enterococcus faecalis TaxID=1351 RepID=UPI0012B44DD6|nr:DUF3173 domain-containing protein [Enterococcus faecalis]